MSAAAIAAGQFKDEVAAAVEGLSDLGGGRIYATRDELVRSETRQVMARIDPRTMQRPEMFGTAAPGFRSRHHELHPGQAQMPNKPAMSKLGIVITPDTPVRTLANPSNKIKQRTYAKKGNNLHLRGPTNYRAAGSTLADAQGVAAQKPTARFQSLTSAPGPPKKTPAAGTLLDKKRANAVFEGKVVFIKGGGTDLKKSVWAIVLLSPADAPYMGHFILFVKKKEAYSLENEVVLNIVRGEAENGKEVVLRIKENEVRESSHRLVFHDAAKAKEFLATISRLLNGGIDVVPPENPFVAVVVPEEAHQATTRDVAGPGAVSVTEDMATSSVPSVAAPTQPNVEVGTASTAPAPTQLGDTESTKRKAAPVSINKGEAGSSVNPVTSPSLNGSVGHDAAHGHGKEPKKAQVKAHLVDLLSGEDLPSDSIVETVINASQPAGTVADSDMGGLDSPLFDLGPDELSSQQSQPAHTSNTDQLEGLDAWYEANPSSSGHEDHGVVKNDAELPDKTPGQVGADTQPMFQCLQGMVDSLLAGFGSVGVAGNSSVELKQTITAIKQTVVGSMRSFARDPSYFPGLTEQQKLQVFEDFLAEPEDTQEETTQPEAGLQDTAVQSTEETSDSGADTSSPSSAATAVPRRIRRMEYSTQRLLDARPNAVAPPGWLKELGFLPPVPASAKGAAAKEPVKQESSGQATPTRSATPFKPGTHGILPERSVSVTPLGRNLLPRPAAPPTPVRSPSPAIAKLELKFEKLSLRDELVKAPVPTVKVEEASSPVKQSTPVLQPVNSPLPPTLKVERPNFEVDKPTVKVDKAAIKVDKPAVKVGKPTANVEKPSPSVERAVPLYHKDHPAERKVGTKDSASAAKHSELSTQPKVDTSGSKALDSTKRELKANIHGAASNLPKQAKRAAAGPPASNAENARAQVVTAVAKSDGHANGQLTSRGLDPQAAPCHLPLANQQTGTTQQNASAGGLRGLNNSRWATRTETKVEKEGRFTGHYSYEQR